MEPHCERLRAFKGTLALKQTAYPQVFIKVWKVDKEAVTKKLPIAPLLRRRMDQPWIPFQRDCEHAAIHKLYGESCI